MSDKTIVVEKSIAAWRKEPAFVEAYQALDEEFAFASEAAAAHTRMEAGDHVGKIMLLTEP